MEKCIDKPQPISPFAPKILTMKISPDKIGALIGPGGKNIKALKDKYSVEINVEDDGTVQIYGKTGRNAEEAKIAVKGICEDPEVGHIYEGTVKRIMDFGAFVEILPGKEGLCHISKLSRQRVEKVTYVLKEGQVIPVKLLEVDKMGRSSIDILLINTVIPYKYAYALHRNNPHKAEEAAALMEQIAPENNTIIRQWRVLGQSIKNAADTQALLHLYQNYCQHHECINCEVGYQIFQDRQLRLF
jgi:predicted RNA-binding protein with RPS1 domain